VDNTLVNDPAYQSLLEPSADGPWIWTDDKQLKDYAFTPEPERGQGMTEIILNVSPSCGHSNKVDLLPYGQFITSRQRWFLCTEREVVQIVRCSKCRQGSLIITHSRGLGWLLSPIVILGVCLWNLVY